MTGVLKQIADTGKNVVLVVGDAHRENLKSALLTEGIEVEVVEKDRTRATADRFIAERTFNRTAKISVACCRDG